MEAKHVPDCLALELEDAVDRLTSSGWDAVVRVTQLVGKSAPLLGPQRVLRQKLLPSGQVELVVAHAC
jgi:hypothetical protein